MVDGSALEVKMEQEPVKAVAAKPMHVDANTGAIVVRDNAELMRMIRMMMKGMAFPKSLDTEDKIIAAWQVAASLKIPPAVAMQNMAVINGSVCIWGQLPKALAEATGELEDYKLILIDEQQQEISLANKNLNSEVWGAVVQVKRRGRTKNEYYFTLPEAKAAGLLNKSGPWKDYRKVMLSRRAIGQAIKFEFPDAVMGVGIAEYDQNEAPDLKDVTPPAKQRVEQAQKFWETVNGKTAEPEIVTDDTAQGCEGVPGQGGAQD